MEGEVSEEENEDFISEYVFEYLGIGGNCHSHRKTILFKTPKSTSYKSLFQRVVCIICCQSII